MPSFYETDIAPYASKFFSQVSSDPRLSASQRNRIQGTLLNGMEDIEATRLKLQEERDKGRARELQYVTGVEALEDARRARSRMLERESKLGAVQSDVRSILAADADPDTKREAFGLLAAENMDVLKDDPGARSILGFAADSLPKPKTGAFTPTKMVDLLQNGVPPEVLQSGDYAAIAAHAEAYEREQAAAEEAKKMNATQKRELAKMPLKYAKWTNPETGAEEEDRWLDPASTERAKAVVAALGTPEELKRFDELKKADSDRERELLVTRIQLRHLAGGEKKSGVRELMGLR